MKKKIILIASRGRSTNILYNYIAQYFEIEKVVLENNISTGKFLRYRLKKLGIIRFLDQLLFILITGKLLSVLSRKRIGQIMKTEALNDQPIPADVIIEVDSLNDASSIELVKNLSADIVLVNGTRILSKRLINAVNAKFVNLHAGITPDYRGVHGAYWAYASKEPDAAGVTLHYVDAGVDTGEIIAQCLIVKTKYDNFSTYPLLQLSAGLLLLKKFLSDDIEPSDPPVTFGKNKSRQWYHPGFFQYLYNLIFKNVK